MSEIWDRHSVGLDDTSRSDDVLNSVKHQQDVSAKLSLYEKAVMPSAPAPLAPQPAAAAVAVADNRELVNAILQSQSTSARNLIKCERYDGGASDKFEYKY